MVLKKKEISPIFMEIELKTFFTFLRSNTPFLKVFLVKNSLFFSYNVIDRGKMLTVAFKLQHLNRTISKTFPSDLFPSSLAPQIQIIEINYIKLLTSGENFE